MNQDSDLTQRSLMARDFTRRNLLRFAGNSLTGTAMAHLLMRDSVACAGSVPGQAIGWPHHAPKAKRVVHLCLCGGLSQLDSFDYKPELAKAHGQALKSPEKPATFFDRIGLLRMNDWEFKQRGQSGLWISELFPHLATVADELTIINSMVADSANHTPATFEENSGFRLNGFPSWAPGSRMV